MRFKFIPDGNIPCDIEMNKKGVLSFNKDGFYDTANGKEIVYLQSITGIETVLEEEAEIESK